MCGKVFFFVFCFLVVLFYFSLCFFSFLFGKSLKRPFSCTFRVFFPIFRGHFHYDIRFFWGGAAKGGYSHIYIYIYICCEVIIWAKCGHFRLLLSGPSRCYYLGQVVLAYNNSGFKRFLEHTVIILCFFLCPIIWQLSENSLFQKRVQKLCFSIFCVLSLNFENSLFLGLLKHYKNRGFS